VKTDIYKHTATVTFDDTKTSVKEMASELAKGEFPVVGEPTFLK